ncbi:MAG: hypothetical protein ACOVSI_08550 [Gemmatimonas sp.]|jgi:hypothetical protein
MSARSLFIRGNTMALLWRTLILTVGVVIPLYIGVDWMLVRAGLFSAIKWRAIVIGALLFAVGSYWQARRTRLARAGIAPDGEG